MAAPSRPTKPLNFGALGDAMGQDGMDTQILMSGYGGGADVACQGLSGPFLAKRRHSGFLLPHRFSHGSSIVSRPRGDRQWFSHWSANPEDTFAEAFQLAEKALALDDTDSMVHAHLCMLHVYRRECGEAGYRIEEALRLNPNDTKVLGIYGEYLIVVGESTKAIELLDTLTRLNPIQPAWITRLKAIAYMTAGRYDDAISLLKSLESPINLVRAWLASSLANAGRLKEAKEMLDEYLRVAEREMVVFPGRSLAAWKAAWHGIPYKNQEDSERFFEGLRKAGLTE